MIYVANDIKEIWSIIEFTHFKNLRLTQDILPTKNAQGVGITPGIFAFPYEFYVNISHGYVFGVLESNGDNEKILSLLHDFENLGQTPFCMTWL